MAWKTRVEKGETLTNEKLAKRFVCSRTGKIRRGAVNDCLIVVWNSMVSEADRWTGDTLNFTGLREEDDWAMNNALNRALRDSRENGVPVYLFELVKANSYEYIGFAELADAPRRESRTDSDGETRTAWVFPLKCAGTALKRSASRPFVDDKEALW